MKSIKTTNKKQKNYAHKFELLSIFGEKLQKKNVFSFSTIASWFSLSQTFLLEGIYQIKII